MQKRNTFLAKVMWFWAAICTIILGAIGSLLAAALGYLPGMTPFLQSCAKFLVVAWAFFFETTALPHWALLFWVILCVWAISLIVRLARKQTTEVHSIVTPPTEGMRQNKAVHVRSNNPLAYTHDIIEGLWWYWTRSLVDKRLHIKKCCCPQCRLELDVRTRHDLATNVDLTTYHCDEHGQVAELNGNSAEVERRVLKIIQRNYDNGTWKAIVKKQENGE